MNETQARLAYEDWCRYRRKRKSEAGWELWQAAYSAGSTQWPEMERLAELPAHKQPWVLSVLKSAIDTAKDL